MTEISYKDIKRAYFSKTDPEKIYLCYSGREVNVKQLKIKDKKDFLKVIEKEDDSLLDGFIDNLIEKYVSDSEGNPIRASLLVDQERHQLLMMIRKLSTTNEHILIDHICPKCTTVNNNIKFELKNIVTTPFKQQEDSMIVSKNGNVKFTLGLLTRGESLEIEKYIKEKNIDTEVEKEFVHLSSTVKEMYLQVDDVEKKYIPSISDRIEFVEGLSFDDFDKIKEYFNNYGDFGVSLQFDFKCTNCDHKNEKEEAKIANFFIK